MMKKNSLIMVLIIWIFSLLMDLLRPRLFLKDSLKLLKKKNVLLEFIVRQDWEGLEV